MAKKIKHEDLFNYSIEEVKELKTILYKLSDIEGVLKNKFDLTIGELIDPTSFTKKLLNEGS